MNHKFSDLLDSETSEESPAQEKLAKLESVNLPNAAGDEPPLEGELTAYAPDCPNAYRERLLLRVSELRAAGLESDANDCLAEYSRLERESSLEGDPAERVSAEHVENGSEPDTSNTVDATDDQPAAIDANTSPVGPAHASATALVAAAPSLIIPGTESAEPGPAYANTVALVSAVVPPTAPVATNNSGGHSGGSGNASADCAKEGEGAHTLLAKRNRINAALANGDDAKAMELVDSLLRANARRSTRSKEDTNSYYFMEPEWRARWAGQNIVQICQTLGKTIGKRDTSGTTGVDFWKRRVLTVLRTTPDLETASLYIARAIESKEMARNAATRQTLCYALNEIQLQSAELGKFDPSQWVRPIRVKTLDSTDACGETLNDGHGRANEGNGEVAEAVEPAPETAANEQEVE